VNGAIRSLPVPVIGGVCIMLFGVVAASGLRMLIEAKVDYSKSRNLLLSAIILVIGISGVSIKVGQTQLKGMVLATIVAIVLSLFLYVLDRLHITNEEADTPVASADPEVLLAEEPV
jgi:uracil permease